MSVEELVDMARTESWDEVDGILPSICEDEDYVNWAMENGILDNDGNVRDLAVSILEKTHRPEFTMVRGKLRELMVNDDNPYVRFRSGFALYGHGDRSRAVIDVLRKATKDGDVAEIARKYLEDD